MKTLVENHPVTVADLVQTLRAQQSHPITAPAADDGSQAPRRTDGSAAQSVVVVGAHPGAGTTAVAVAGLDALAGLPGERGDGRVRLIDTAAHGASGMTAATQRQMAGIENDWRIGRRGLSSILRPVVSPTCPGQVPDIPAEGSGWLVVDAGWGWREVLAAPNPIRRLLECANVLVICRATVPGVGHMELALQGLPGLRGQPLVAAVGARRWPAAAAASFGPRLAHTVGAGRAVLVPADRRVEVNGVDAEEFPRPIAAAATQLAGLLRSDALESPPVPTSRGVFR